MYENLQKKETDSLRNYTFYISRMSNTPFHFVTCIFISISKLERK